MGSQVVRPFEGPVANGAHVLLDAVLFWAWSHTSHGGHSFGANFQILETVLLAVVVLDVCNFRGEQ